jgi:hypothetical protein
LFILFLYVLYSSAQYLIMEQEEFMADPQQLQAEARKEPRRRGLDDYRDTIRLLKEEKGFSLREIAAWLQERGVNVDHNAVWRTYSKGLSGRLVSGRIEQSEQYEQRRASDGSMTWM